MCPVREPTEAKVSDRSKLLGLDAFPEWRNAKPQLLD